MVRIAHEQVTGMLDAEGWIDVKISPDSGYQSTTGPDHEYRSASHLTIGWWTHSVRTVTLAT